MTRRHRLAALALAGALALASAPGAAVPPVIAPFADARGAQLPAPWRVVTLPKIPRHTRYTLEPFDGRVAVHAVAEASYATAVHPVDADLEAAPWLSFAWRIERFPANVDLRTKAGDDVAARVCVLFDVPLERLGRFDRTRVQLARRLFDPALPAATICYVWDPLLPPGLWLPNAYTDRVRLLVLRSGADAEPARWLEERRDLRADFRAAFPAEAAAGWPKIAAIAFATDADNTRSRAAAWFADFALTTE